jgi:hypothetical protein
MATVAECDEIIFAVFARMTPKLLMMDFEVVPRTAELATPPVAPQRALA